MSVHTVERVFWEFGNEPERAERFKADPAAYLADYPLSDEERRMIREVDVRALVDHGVSSLLLMMAWPLLEGPDDMPFDYLTRMNGGKLPSMGLKPMQHLGLRGFLAVRRLGRALRPKRAAAAG